MSHSFPAQAKKKKRAEYRIIFNRYDEDRGGTVDADELDAVFQDMGKVLPKEEIDAMLLEYADPDAEHDEVYFDEFCTMLEALDAKEKKEQQRLEERAAREAAKHRAFAALAAPALPPGGAARRGSATPGGNLEGSLDDEGERKRRGPRAAKGGDDDAKGFGHRGSGDTLKQRWAKNTEVAVFRTACGSVEFNHWFGWS
ncbi:hypothetical protein JL720_3601 [Aureococcus anophagefferens]|nr:hypothetical protein JL720_3601 [Aureococcus anophagefferens]